MLKHFRNLVDETASKARFLSTFQRVSTPSSDLDSALGPATSSAKYMDLDVSHADCEDSKEQKPPSAAIKQEAETGTNQGSASPPRHRKLNGSPDFLTADGEARVLKSAAETGHGSDPSLRMPGRAAARNTRSRAAVRATDDAVYTGSSPAPSAASVELDGPHPADHSSDSTHPAHETSAATCKQDPGGARDRHPHHAADAAATPAAASHLQHAAADGQSAQQSRLLEDKKTPGSTATAQRPVSSDKSGGRPPKEHQSPWAQPAAGSEAADGNESSSGILQCARSHDAGMDESPPGDQQPAGVAPDVLQDVAASCRPGPGALQRKPPQILTLQAGDLIREPAPVGLDAKRTAQPSMPSVVKPERGQAGGASPAAEQDGQAMEQLMAVVGESLEREAARQLLQEADGDVGRAINFLYDRPTAAAAPAAAASAGAQASGTAVCMPHARGLQIPSGATWSTRHSCSLAMLISHFMVTCYCLSSLY